MDLLPHAGAHSYDAASLKKQWARLHAGDTETLPKDAAVLQAWVHFHNGDFQKASETGLAAGGAGITAANKAAAIRHLPGEKGKTRLDLFLQVAGWRPSLEPLSPKTPMPGTGTPTPGPLQPGHQRGQRPSPGAGAARSESLEKAIALSCRRRHRWARIIPR